VSQVNNFLSSYNDIVNVTFIGHSSKKAIYVGSSSLPDTNISMIQGPNDVNPNSLNWSNLTSDATINIWGCNAGSGGSNSISQSIANSSGANVTAPNSTINFEEFRRIGRTIH